MSDFERIKSALNLLNIITQGTSLQMKGKHLEHCPLCTHRECFSIYDGGDKWKCHSCGEQGDVFNFLEKFHDIDSHEALKMAAGFAGVELSEPSHKEPPKESVKDKVLRMTAEYYHANMMRDDCPGRKWFVETRGHSAETLETMKAGWSDGGLMKHLQEQDIKLETAIKYGVLDRREIKGTETVVDYFLPNQAIFPVIDHEGKVISLTCKDPNKKLKDIPLRGGRKWVLNYAALGKYSETFIVEGENDLASLIDIGMKNVIGVKGQPSREQITLIKNVCSGKTVYLWFDQDKQRDDDIRNAKWSGGAGHTSFIRKELEGSGVKYRMVVHPGETKDPDEYIQDALKTKSPAEVRHLVRDLKDESKGPITWELEMISKIEGTRERVRVFKAREIHKLIYRMESAADQEAMIDLAAGKIGISAKAVDEEVNQAADLYNVLMDKYETFNKLKKSEPYDISRDIFKWFNNGANAKFFKTEDEKTYLFYQRKIYEIDRNLPFDHLMYRLTRLSFTEKPGPSVWNYLRLMCYDVGELVDMMSWMYADREKDTIYMNFKSHHNKIIRIAPNEDPQVIDNGTNDHSVLLSDSPQMKHMEYMPDSDVADGLQSLKFLMMDTTPCEGPQRYFMIAWVISTGLMQYQSDRGLLQIIASSAVGKSKVAERISQLIYGENYTGKGTGAAETRVATKNPLIILDNLENRNLNMGTVDFLLLLANSSHKPKAKGGSDTDVLYQKLFCMAVITSIEAFPGRIPELVNRTFPLQLEGRYKQDGYMHDEVMRSILKKRPQMLSAIFKMITRDVLPRLTERQFWSKKIQTDFPGHHKNRNDEHLCTMMIITEALLQYIPFQKETPARTQASALLSHWIGYWDDQEGQTAITSNTLLVLMDGLAKEILIKLRGKKEDEIEYQIHPEFEKPYPDYINKKEKDDTMVKVYDDPEYLETFYLTYPYEAPDTDEDSYAPVTRFQNFELITTAKDLFTLFNRYCKNQGIRNPFENPTSLGARISNDRKIMAQAGWTYIQKKQDRKQYKKIGGDWHWRFSKKIRALG